MKTSKEINLTCPISISDYPRVQLAHGGGGKLMQQLIEKMFINTFSDLTPQDSHDAAVLEIPSSKIAFTTDSYVVNPLIFPGGDIGSLAVHGTINDLAMSGAKARFLSLGLILEEGLPMETLWQITRSIKAAAQAANVRIVTGDTKVVDKGKGDGIFINTSGIGIIEHDQKIHPSQIKAGDSLIINGDLGRHGMAIMAARESLGFESAIESDSAALGGLIDCLIKEKINIHCLRDLTRGGLSSALNELSQSAQLGMEIEEASIPVRGDVSAACELLGLDPLYVANEGRFVAIIDKEDSQRAINIMQKHPLGKGACLIGQVNEDKPLVTIKRKIGTRRILDMLSGEQLPRIC